mgnify:CR=1 FL=1
MDMFINFLAAAIAFGTPILYGIVGEIMNERVGHLNLGVEGMMSFGAFLGFMCGYTSESFALAVLGAFAGGMLMSFIYVLLTVTFMANQNVAGLTLTVFGIGLSNFLGQIARSKTADGTLRLSEAFKSQMDVHFGALENIPVIGKLLFSYNWLVYLGVIVALLMSFYLKKTKTGLNVCAIGENPAAADAAGIKVTKLKYINILLGGGICGLGGLCCGVATTGGIWIENCVNGIGWIAVALVVLAKWRPAHAIWGAYVFGAFGILRHYVPSNIFGSGIPQGVYDMLPFIITALVLVIDSMRKKKSNSIPQALGTNYFREER